MRYWPYGGRRLKTGARLAVEVVRVEGEGGEGRGESTSGILVSHCVTCGLLKGGRRAMISWREALMAAKARSSCCWVMYVAVVEGDGGDGGEEGGTEDGEL